MKFSVFTASTPEWTPAEAAAALAAQGWDGVEWRVTDQEDAPEPGFWTGNRATWPLTGLAEHLPAIAEVTHSAGLEFSAIGGYVRSDDRPNVERMLTDLEWAAARAADHGVAVLVELHHRTIVASASAAVRLLDGLDPAHVGVIHDIGNLVIEGYEDYAAAFDMLGPYLAHVHVKNVAWRPAGRAADGTVTWVAEWAPLRDGQADLAGYLAALRAHGYDGWVTCEDFSTAVPLAERTRDNLAYLQSLWDRGAAGGHG
ncbi:MAG: xylose isomerase [Catenulispora sp. 13_1_20CM_3_70_7]|nr:MAG: xylose isomerase [Catenulispora sp. 13_1_20CM_3_70_7]